jgi:regulator of sigma E protease
LRGGDVVRRAALGDAPLAPVASFDALRWVLLRGALDQRDVRLEVTLGNSGAARTAMLPLSQLTERDPDARMFRRIGIPAPLSAPVIGKLMTDGAGERAGLQTGDLVRRVGDTAVVDGGQLRDLIRTQINRAGDRVQPKTLAWRIERRGQVLTLDVTPDVQTDHGQPVGRIGAYVGSAPEMVLVRLGPLDGLTAGVAKVWQLCTMTLRYFGRMLIGQVSVKNVSGVVGVADLAGQAASLGWVYYLGFLAFMSASLGVMNLLPVPMLDGGHLMYYLWEAVTGKPVAGVWFNCLQYAGLSLLLAVMALTLVNDVTIRLLG